MSILDMKEILLECYYSRCKYYKGKNDENLKKLQWLQKTIN